MKVLLYVCVYVCVKNILYKEKKSKIKHSNAMKKKHSTSGVKKTAKKQNCSEIRFMFDINQLSLHAHNQARTRTGTAQGTHSNVLTTHEQISHPLFQVAPSCLMVPLTRHDR